MLLERPGPGPERVQVRAGVRGRGEVLEELGDPLFDELADGFGVDGQGLEHLARRQALDGGLNAAVTAAQSVADAGGVIDLTTATGALSTLTGLLAKLPAVK